MRNCHRPINFSFYKFLDINPKKGNDWGSESCLKRKGRSSAFSSKGVYRSYFILITLQNKANTPRPAQEDF